LGSIFDFLYLFFLLLLLWGRRWRHGESTMPALPRRLYESIISLSFHVVFCYVCMPHAPQYIFRSLPLPHTTHNNILSTTHTPAHIHIHTYTHTHIHTYTHTHTHTYTHTHTHIPYTHTHTHIHTHTYTHTHTHIHIHTYGIFAFNGVEPRGRTYPLGALKKQLNGRASRHGERFGAWCGESCVL